jgi:hypothetical protein
LPFSPQTRSVKKLLLLQNFIFKVAKFIKMCFEESQWTDYAESQLEISVLGHIGLPAGTLPVTGGPRLAGDR